MQRATARKCGRPTILCDCFLFPPSGLAFAPDDKWLKDGLRKALTRQRKNGQTRPDALDQSAHEFVSRGDYLSALSLHEEALALRRRFMPEDQEAIAISLENVARAHEGNAGFDNVRVPLTSHLALAFSTKRPLPSDHDTATAMAKVSIPTVFLPTRCDRGYLRPPRPISRR